MKALIITDKYYPQALANAICAQALGEAFVAGGHQVQMLIFKDSGIEPPKTFNGIKVHSVRPDLRYRLFYFYTNFPKHRYAGLAHCTANFLAKIKKILLFPLNPLYSLSFPRRLLRKMESLDEKEHYNLIISVFSPFEAALAGMWFKKRHPDHKWCLYMLDSFIALPQNWIPLCLRSMRVWLPGFFDAADAVIYMKSRINEFDDKRFDRWKEKLYISDIPLMQKTGTLPALVQPTTETHIENWVYAGSLSKNYYDMTDVIACFLALPQDRERVLHIYSRGAEFEKLKKQYVGDCRVQCHDYVPHDELMEIYKNANILVSQKSSDHISAKIFEYMTYNKRIVHFSGTISEPNLHYIKQYSNGVCVVSYKGTVEQRAKKLYEQLLKWEKEPIPLQADLSPFEMNTPEYTRDLILKAIGYF